MVSRLIYIVILGGIIFSCSSSKKNIVLENQEIQNDVKNEIAELVRIVDQAIKENSPQLIEPIKSELLGDTDIKNLIEVLHIKNGDGKLEILDQYYTVNIPQKNDITIYSANPGLDTNDYQIHFSSQCEKNYVVLQTTATPNSSLICMIFGKYDEGWKLNVLCAGPYEIDYKTAPELYLEAEKQFNEEHVAESYLTQCLAAICSQPIGPYLEYNRIEALSEFSEQIDSTFKKTYHLPLEFSNITTKPQLLNMYPIGIDIGYFPMIEYLSAIPLSDTIQLKEENALIQTSMDSIFPEFSSNNEYLFYRAFNEKPNTRTKTSNYGFVQRNDGINILTQSDSIAISDK